MNVLNLISRYRKADGGQALVEFALVVPFLLLLLVGIVEFGRGWNQHQVITDAAREGARKAAIFDESIDEAAIRGTVESALAAAGIDPADAEITLTDWAGESNTPVTVAIDLPYQLTFFGSLMRWTTGESSVMLRTSFTMRNE
jgi:Flp pilus assembly protein TadG